MMKPSEALDVLRKWQECTHKIQETPCKGFCPECEYYATDEQMDDAINLAISALEKQEQDRWIPVAERLPEKDGEHLVTYEKGYAEDYGFDLIGIAPFEADCEGFGIWQENFDHVTLGSLGSEWVDILVTAWRPLPEPYQEEES